MLNFTGPRPVPFSFLMTFLICQLPPRGKPYIAVPRNRHHLTLKASPVRSGPPRWRWVPWGMGSKWVNIIHGNKDQETDLVIISANVSGLAHDADVLCVQEVCAPDTTLRRLAMVASRAKCFLSWGPQKTDTDMRSQRGFGCGFVSRLPLGRCHADSAAVSNRVSFASLPSMEVVTLPYDGFIIPPMSCILHRRC